MSKVDRIETAILQAQNFAWRMAPLAFVCTVAIGLCRW